MVKANETSQQILLHTAGVATGLIDVKDGNQPKLIKE
jgi:hypothetical protein